MAGFVLTDPNADFSSFGLGNINLSEIYIANAVITNATQKTAIRNFYTTLKNAGLLTKLQVARLYFAGTALADSINLIKPYLGAVNNQAFFTNDTPTAHTSAGWTPNTAAGRYAQSNFFINGNINNFHGHVWNSTPAATDNATKFLLGAGANEAGNSFIFYMSRRNAGYTKSVISPWTPVVNILSPVGYDTQKTGLLSLSRQSGGVTKMYDDATIIKQQTLTDSWTTSGATQMDEGTFGSYNQFADCTLRFIGYGFSNWTDADETNLNNAIKAFNTALA